MTEKKLQIEDRKDWAMSYGDFSVIYPNARNFFYFAEKYVDLKMDKMRVLEYGCALGYYLKVLKHDNKTAELYGLDIANKAIESSIYNTGIVRSHFFWQSCSESLPMSNNFFDFIYGLDIIEHIEDDAEIDAWFKEAGRLLKPSGVFILIAPNCNWPMRKIYDLSGQSWIYSGRAHKRHFSKKTLSRWAKKYFKVAHAGPYNHRPAFFKKLLRALGISRHIVLILQKNENSS